MAQRSRRCGRRSGPRPVQGEIEGKYRAAAGVVARVNVAAVKARVLGGDRQAQSTALRTCPRRIGLVEPVEYVPDCGERQRVAVVAHFYRPPPRLVALRLAA